MLQKTPEEEALDAALKSLIDEEMYNLQAKIINHKNIKLRINVRILSLIKLLIWSVGTIRW